MADCCCECVSNILIISEPSQNGNDKCRASLSNSPGCDLRRCKNYELRGGIFYVTCDCIKRNGLQDDCRRTCCQGSCECQTWPEPMCCPSKYAKRLMLIPMGVKKRENQERIF